MNLRMGIKISSPHFDISFVIFKERAFLDRDFYTVACRLFNKTEIVGSGSSETECCKIHSSSFDRLSPNS